MAGRFRHDGGGIAGLVRQIAEHGEAIEYDLITRAGMSLDDVPARLSWRALGVFVRHLDASSAYVREVAPDTAPWIGTDLLATMTADLIDALRILDWHFCQANTPKGKPKPRKPKPYPRPWKTDDSTVKVGRDPIPIKDFDTWWNGGDD